MRHMDIGKQVRRSAPASGPGIFGGIFREVMRDVRDIDVDLGMAGAGLDQVSMTRAPDG